MNRTATQRMFAASSDSAVRDPNASAESPMNAMMRALFEHMLKINASDLYLTNERAPTFRVDGVGHAGKQPATAEQIDEMAESLMTPSQVREFRSRLEMNLAVTLRGGRFRVNVFRQKGATGMVGRLVKTEIKSLDALGHPKALKDVMSSKRGLVLLVGGTGSGKLTTLAAMIDHRNATTSGHIVTIEDPIEFVHPHKNCVVTQREIGVDTHSYSEALKNALRQTPDVVLIGEVRDAETMAAALAFAESGHLCLTTLHSNSADQAIDRILNFFPIAQRHEISMQLSLNLRAIISQRLLPALKGGRVAALEILLDTPRIKELIKRGEIDVLKDAMNQSQVDGCQTFDVALYELCAAGKIAEAEALRSADRPNDLRLRLERMRAGGGAPESTSLRLVGEVRKRPVSGVRSAYLAEVPVNGGAPAARARG